MSTPSAHEALGRDDTAGLGRDDTARLGRDDIAHLARLSRLALTEEELDRFAGQLGAVLDAVAQVSQADVADVDPTTHAVPLTNVLRDDVATPSLPRDVVLAAAPAAEDGRFRVPRILGED
jgi:aspartyl-tRNA(Asn)/glutamyl-tRNA(Gln) amidotransferase subunit C